jgi:CheY-like chemotaxis protein
MTENARKSILLVEDEENLHDALRLNLELENYKVTSAYDGNEALKAVTEEYFDLVILDVMLPGMDGINVAETIRVRQNPVPTGFLVSRKVQTIISTNLLTWRSFYFAFRSSSKKIRNSRKEILSPTVIFLAKM